MSISEILVRAVMCLMALGLLYDFFVWASRR
jgi:hypothetical protein